MTMKNAVIISLLAGALLISISSCAPVYKCGETPTGKKMINKRLRDVVQERDTLCANLGVAESTNTRLSEELTECAASNRQLNTDLADFRQRHNQLMNENMSQAEQFNAALRQKSEELKQQERLLAERENALREMQAMISRQDSITRRLNEIVRNALLGFNSDELTVEVKNGKVYVSMSDKLLFRSGSAGVESKGRDALKVLAEVLEKNADIDVLVEGHTDNVPIRTAQFRDNWDLSVVRATSIVRILTEDYKLSPLRVTASGKGEFMPRASNDNSEGRARNRRTEIILSPKLDELMKLLEGGN